jgi:CO/xanthine dehydrogenase Mo-binding subunit
LGSEPKGLIFAQGRVEGKKGSITFQEAVTLARTQGKPLSASHIYTPPPTVPLGEEGDAHFAYGYATQAAQVEVDITIRKVKVVKVVAAHDVGRAINPLAIEGQLEGGVLMGLGFALMEDFEVKEGRPQKTTLTKYKIPTVRELPEIIPMIVEDEASEGPYGAKGVGEITSIPTAAAIINAIYDAIGVRFTRLPVAPERVLAALQEEGK